MAVNIYKISRVDTNTSLSNIGSIACTEGYEASKPDTVVTADQEALWARVWFEVKLVQ